MKVGLLPLYLALYDQRMPELRSRVELLLDRVVLELEKQGVEVHRGAVCRVESEVQASVRTIEASGCSAIVTVHLAYSPSLEAAGVLCTTRLPVVICDTTISADFGLDSDVNRILTDHGIHGAMDLCSVLRRNGKAFSIVAGGSVDRNGDPCATYFARLAGVCRGAVAGAGLRGQQLVRVGETFKGMGDFAVGDDLLKQQLGWGVEEFGAEWIGNIAVDEESVLAEVLRDRARWRVTADDDTHRRSVRMGLRLRRLLGEADGFSFNFQAFDGVAIDGGCCVPFLEASKAMERGIGYAGEGDVLTAGLVGTLTRAFGGSAVTFCEVFCPDWAGDTLFLSHMGEINPGVLVPGTEHLLRKPYPWGDAADPTIVVGALRPGPAILVDLTLGHDNFELIAAEVEVLGDSTNPEMQQQIRGWIRPKVGAARFLERYSQAGGTHHHALVWGASLEAIHAMSRTASLPLTVI